MSRLSCIHPIARVHRNKKPSESAVGVIRPRCTIPSSYEEEISLQSPTPAWLAIGMGAILCSSRHHDRSPNPSISGPSNPDFDVAHMLEAGKLSAAADGLEIVVRRQGGRPASKV
jgi:hypothetical protein